VDAATGQDVPGASAGVNMTDRATDSVYSSLAAPVQLTANKTYYLVSQETSGGDLWFDQFALSTKPDGTVLNSVFSLGSGYAPNEANTSYGPPNFLYTN
jgi:hypothetical protein